MNSELEVRLMDFISAHLFLEFRHWPLSDAEKTTIGSPDMVETLSMVEDWKEKEHEQA